jgi:DeoR family transcriptional regulator, catabolite repression regulator
MALNDRQLRILRAIDEGHTTGETIVDALGSSMQMLSYYINQMVEDGYIKAAKVYDNELRDFIVVRAYLTPEGKTILAERSTTTTLTNTSSSASTADSTGLTATVQTAPVATPASTTDTIDYGLITATLEQVESIITSLPTDWRELAEVYLDDLKNEINIAYRRRPVRIKAYFLAILRTLLPLTSKMVQGPDFIQQVRSLSQQLGIPVKLPGD